MIRRRTAMRSVARSRRAWNDLLKQIAFDEGIPDSYRQVIMFLYHNPGAAQRRIAEFAGITTSAVNQTVKSMLAEAYLRRESDPSDKRSCKLYLTEKGEEVATRLRKKLDHVDDLITAHIGAEKEIELMNLLDELTGFIQEELKEC